MDGLVFGSQRHVSRGADSVWHMTCASCVVKDTNTGTFRNKARGLFVNHQVCTWIIVMKSDDHIAGLHLYVICLFCGLLNAETTKTCCETSNSGLHQVIPWKKTRVGWYWSPYGACATSGLPKLLSLKYSWWAPIFLRKPTPWWLKYSSSSLASLFQAGLKRQFRDLNVNNLTGVKR